MASSVRHPEYNTYFSRLKSFEKVNRGIYKNGQTFEELASAGFFYAGPGDRVRCFHCDGGLKNFCAGDIPKDEHYKYFKTCQFIKNLTETRINIEERINIHNNPPITATATSFEQRDIRARMDMSIIISLKNSIGCTDEQMKEAIKEQLSNNKDYNDLTDLFNRLSKIMEISTSTNTFTTPEIPATNPKSVAVKRKHINIQIEQPKLAYLEETSVQTGNRKCLICKENEVNVVVLPCGELNSCRKCIDNISKCPKCKIPITDKIDVVLN